MANEQNLIPFSERSESEARENGRKGGIASGASRRRKKSLREAADLYLSLPVRNKKTLNSMVKDGVEPDDADNQMAIIVSLSKMAVMGDSKSAKVLFDLLGDGVTGPADNAKEDDLSRSLRELGKELESDGW